MYIHVYIVYKGNFFDLQFLSLSRISRCVYKKYMLYTNSRNLILKDALQCVAHVQSFHKNNLRVQIIFFIATVED